MNRRSIVAALAVAAAVAAGAAAVALHYLRPAQLVAAVAGKLKQSTGRELVVTGATGIKLFPRPAIVLEDVRFGNAAWASQPWMATVGRAEAEMQWGPLLRGEIDIASIHLAGAALLLETDAAGNGNWAMGAPDSAPIDLSWLAGFAVAELRIEPFAVAYRDGATGNTTRVALETVTLEAPPAPQPIRFQTHGRYSGKRFEAQGSIGALAALLAGDRPYPLTLSATSGNSKLEISGEAGQPSQLAGLSLDVSAHGAALADLEVLFPRALGPWLAEHDREGHLPGLAYSLGWHLAGNWNAFSLSGMNIVV
ncbi:MAG TPA: AsmA family protein, partial [Burkholderiales bacterium]|nr:AsmA family protein [Burkholderiales bacterium]